MDTFVKVVGTMIGLLAAGVFIAALLGLPVMWLWNALMPEIFGLKTIGFWQAVGLNVLCSILFKGTSTSSSSK